MQYEVIIAGGGMVGATLACLLGKAGRRVAVLEAHAPAELAADADYGLRVSAISRVSQQVLAQAGAWDRVLARRASPYEAMHVWDATGNGCIRFEAADLGEPELGHIVENQVLQQALLATLADYPSVSVCCPARLAAFERTDDRVTVLLHDGQPLQAELLVGADGAHSRVRKLAGMSALREDYGQQGVVCTVRTELPHQATAWQRFMPTGPLAFLPLPDAHTCSMVWTLPADYADTVLAFDEARFREALAEALDYRLGAVLQVSARAAFPLSGMQASHYVQPRLALLGDAAHTIHPLAGQGVNLGIKDAAALAAQLLNGKTTDMGSLRVLERYARARRGDNLLTQKAMESFRLLFGNTLAPWVLLRNTGLNAVNSLPLLKYELARRAMGIA